MLTDDNLISTSDDQLIRGCHKIYRFESGYGLSLINGQELHAFPFAWEIAVLKDVSKNGDEYSITYDTELTDDVEIFTSDDEANQFICEAKKALG